MNKNYDIAGKIALVTGANRGIGKAIVDVFLHNGATKVYAAVRNPGSAAPLVERYGDKVVPVCVDLAKPETITALAEATKDAQVVVNNAGVFIASTPMDSDAINSLELAMKINVFGLIRMAQAFAPVLKINGGGAFVQLNSVASLKCTASFATHSASKAAAYSITQALRELLGRQGTAVLSVHPGLIATDMSSAAGLAGLAEPPSFVAEGIVIALKAGEFHLFPDSMARRIGSAYQSFSESVIEADISEYGTDEAKS
ncbi:Short-chain dehydrogenase [Nitrosospira sp. Nl5]|uniref:SDR family oxidoreductase n=1 Tax=Nitrosospira sp. Nl5 TaxID=200120 RepID=UPI00089173D9|nr:SDR family oxidoreductase [Nitrosospira sp. Nl5]SCY60892.1 Short-chain dehydrogenase [Nitrosospira sp. Nl5]